MKKYNGKRKIMHVNKLIIMFSIVFIILILGVSYSWLKLTLNGEKDNVLRAGTLSLILDDTISDGINLDNAVPVSDKKGMTSQEYIFSLTNKGDSKAEYKIYLDDLPLDTNFTRMNDNYIKYSLTKNNDSINGNHKTVIEFVDGNWLITYDPSKNQITSLLMNDVQNDSAMESFNHVISSAENEDDAIDALKGAICSSCTYNINKTDFTGSLISSIGSNPNRIIDSGMIKANTTNTYSLKLWIDSNAGNDVMGTVFTGQLRVEAVQDSTKYVRLNPNLGDYIKMTPTLSRYNINTGDFGTSDAGTTVSSNVNLHENNLWRVIDKKTDGTIEMILDGVVPFGVSGRKGYLNSVGALNKIADLHKNSEFTIATRNAGYSNQTEYLNSSMVDFTQPILKYSTIDNSNENIGGGDIGYMDDANKIYNALHTLLPPNESNSYLLASRVYSYNSDSDYNWGIRIVKNTSTTDKQILYKQGVYETIYGYSARPILTLKANLKVTGSGTIDDPWLLD